MVTDPFSTSDRTSAIFSSLLPLTGHKK